MLSLANARNLTQDLLEKGVIDCFIATSGVMARLPFIEVVGSGYSYNIMEDLPEVGYREINKAYTNNAAEVTKHTEALVILGGDADVDVVLQKTHSNFTDLRALQTEAKAKATAKRFEADFFTGTGAGNSLKGLEQRITDGIAGVKIESELTLDAMNELLDAVAEGANAVFMSKATRRELLKLLQTSGHYIESGKDDFGRQIYNYGGVDIIASEMTPEDKVYAVRFDRDGVCGLSNGGVQVRDLGELQNLPVFRTRIEFVCGLATKHVKSFAVLDIQPKGRKAK